MSRVPNFYLPPWGSPFRWQNTGDSALTKAVRAYINHQCDRSLSVTSEQVEVVRSYCEYYIGAPCWLDDAEKSFAKLRERIKTLKTADEISKWIWECLKHGIDPL